MTKKLSTINLERGINLENVQARSTVKENTMGNGGKLLKTVEIASYPKSGNTWFRHIVSEFLFNVAGIHWMPSDIHSDKNAVLNSDGIYIKRLDSKVLFYKSHTHNSKLVNPDSIIHIYRHPLDVFLSSRNFLYMQAKNGAYNKNALRRLFIGSEPKSVEMMCEDGQLDAYFEDFLMNIGSNYWPAMLGDKSNYFDYVLDAIRCPKTVSVKYEDLLDTFHDVSVSAIEHALGVKFPAVSLDRMAIDRRTKHSGNSAFYWKAKANNYHDFLCNDQVSRFYTQYRDKMSILGY